MRSLNNNNSFTLFTSFTPLTLFTPFTLPTVNAVNDRVNALFTLRVCQPCGLTGLGKRSQRYLRKAYFSPVLPFLGMGVFN